MQRATPKAAADTIRRQTTLAALLRKTGRFEDATVFYSEDGKTACCDVTVRKSAPRLPFRIQRSRDSVLVTTVPTIKAFEPDLRMLLKDIDRVIADFVTIHLPDDGSGVFLVVAAVRNPTAEELGDAIDAVVLIGTDVHEFLVHVLQTPQLRCDPDRAFRAFRRFVADRERDLETASEDACEDESQSERCSVS